VNQKITANFYTLPDAALEIGKTWYWRVTALGGAIPSSSATWKFSIGQESPPPVKAVIVSAPPPPEPVMVPPPAAAPPPPPAPPVPEGKPPPPKPKPAAAPPPAPPVHPPPPEPKPAAPPPPPAPEVKPPSEPEPEITQTSPEAEPAAPQPEPIIAAIPPPEKAPDPLLRVSGSGSITGAFPADGAVLYTEQLAATSSLNFVWKGKASPWRFALLQVNGEALVPQADTQTSAYILSNPGTLKEGEYVWHIYETNGQGKWEELPSKANRFRVVKGRGPFKNLPTQNPGVLYGSR
jgi:hypothetical protein